MPGIGFSPGCRCCAPCNRLVRITVTDYKGSHPSGVTATLTGPGAFSATCITNGSGVCSISVPAVGTYTATYGLGTAIVVVGSACTTYDVAVNDGLTKVVCNVTMCNCSSISGLAVTFKQGGSVVATGTTDGTGHVIVCVPTFGGDTNLSVSAPGERFVDTALTVSALYLYTHGNVVTLPITVASGYTCLSGVDQQGGPFCCQYPLKNTVQCTDSFWSATFPLTYDPSYGGVPPGAWVGTNSVTQPVCTKLAAGQWPGPCDSPATFTMTYVMDIAGDMTIVAPYTCREFVNGVNPDPTGYMFSGSDFVSCPPAFLSTGTTENPSPCYSLSGVCGQGETHSSITVTE